MSKINSQSITKTAELLDSRAVETLRDLQIQPFHNNGSWGPLPINCTARGLAESITQTPGFQAFYQTAATGSRLKKKKKKSFCFLLYLHAHYFLSHNGISNLICGTKCSLKIQQICLLRLPRLETLITPHVLIRGYHIWTTSKLQQMKKAKSHRGWRNISGLEAHPSQSLG